jgi:hypothetical protein
VELSDTMITLWSQFASGKKLNAKDGGNQVTWPMYKQNTGFQLMKFDEVISVQSDNLHFCDLWQ